MSKCIKLVRLEDVVEGTPVAVDQEGLPPLAVYRHGGQCYVTGNLCTHGHALLTDGYQDGTTIECPIHGGAFDIRTGEATLFPCEIPIQTYPVSVEDGYVCIDAGEKQGV